MFGHLANFLFGQPKQNCFRLEARLIKAWLLGYLGEGVVRIQLYYLVCLAKL
jgi:hypothetical protein